MADTFFVQKPFFKLSYNLRIHFFVLGDSQYNVNLLGEDTISFNIIIQYIYPHAYIIYVL